MSEIIEKAKERFLRMIKESGSDPYHLSGHVPEVEKWARHILKSHPEADEEVVILGACLHDLGHYPVPTEIDHAIRGEERARTFLENENYRKTRWIRYCTAYGHTDAAMSCRILSRQRSSLAPILQAI